MNSSFECWNMPMISLNKPNLLRWYFNIISHLIRYLFISNSNNFKICAINLFIFFSFSPLFLIFSKYLIFSSFLVWIFTHIALLTFVISFIKSSQTFLFFLNSGYNLKIVLYFFVYISIISFLSDFIFKNSINSFCI